MTIRREPEMDNARVVLGLSGDDFIRRGLPDFSVSRSAERTRGQGMPVPADEGRTIYVWAGALTDYPSACGTRPKYCSGPCAHFRGSGTWACFV